VHPRITKTVNLLVVASQGYRSGKTEKAAHYGIPTMPEEEFWPSVVGLDIASDGYERRWNDVARQPSDGEGPDVFDLMDEAVGGLTLHQYEQIHLSSTLRDGVTIFEMYFEKSFAEVLERQVGKRTTLPERSPQWDRLRDAWRTLVGFDIETSQVAEIRDRRHWLTHQRGQLRTDAQREKYDTLESGLPDDALRLTEAAVVADLEDLAEVIREADVPAHSRSWGSTMVSATDIGTALKQVGRDLFAHE